MFESLAAIFTVRDVPEALLFYTDTLGFDVGWTWGEQPSYASVCRDRVELNLRGAPECEPLACSSVYISVNDVDGYYECLRQGGVAVNVEIGDRPYGMRDFTIIDPSGNKLSFGQAKSELNANSQ